MIDLARQAGFELPVSEPEALRRFMVVNDAANLEDYLARFEYTIPLLQTAEAIERVSYEMVEDAARDNIRYLEVRYCPYLSRRKGLSMERALEAELAGLARGERDFGVIARVINCSLRHYDPVISVEIARLLGGLSRPRCRGLRPRRRRGRAPRRATPRRLRYRGRGSARHHRPRGRGGRGGIHRGCVASLSCRPHRPRHPALRGSRASWTTFATTGFLLEINITSNVQTRAVTQASEHPVRAYFDAGLTVALCTDGWLMCGVIAERRVPPGAHPARLHPRGAGPGDSERIRERVSSLARARRHSCNGCGAELAAIR